MQGSRLKINRALSLLKFKHISVSLQFYVNLVQMGNENRRL